MILTPEEALTALMLTVQPDTLAWWYCSFVDPDNDVALGVSIFRAPDDTAAALTVSHLSGFNLGGEVAMVPLGEDWPAGLPAEWQNRRFTVREALDAGVVEWDDLGPNTQAAVPW